MSDMSPGNRFKKFGRYWILRSLIVLIAMGLLSTIAGVLFFKIDPVGFRKIVFQPVRELLYFQRELQASSHWDRIEKVEIPPAEKVSITAEDGLKLVADLRIPKGREPAPGIILFHGATPWGRKCGLIRLLAGRLQKKGWVVLCPDRRGFDESDDPKNIMDPEAWNTENDVKRILNFMVEHERSDPNRIYVLGHSAGAMEALKCGVDEEMVKAFILVGPPRVSDTVRIMGPKFPQSTWHLARWSADRGLDHIVKVEGIKPDKLSLQRDILAEKEHKPILFIDGESEGEANLDYLANVFQKINPPEEYHTLPDTGHYCGVYNLFGSDVVYYRPDLFNPFVKIIDDFIERVEKESMGNELMVVEAGE